jgi:hypothetical protein
MSQRDVEKLGFQIKRWCLDNKSTIADLARQMGVSRRRIDDVTGAGRLKKLPTDPDFIARLRNTTGIMVGEDTSPQSSGSYRRPDFQTRLQGTYRTLIGIHRTLPAIGSLRTEFFWAGNEESASYKEIPFTGAEWISHTGRLAHFVEAGIVYLLSNSSLGHGYRQIVLSHDDDGQRLYGYLSSIKEIDGHYYPIVSPIVYIKLGSAAEPFSDGILYDGDENFTDAAALMKRKCGQFSSSLAGFPSVIPPLI